MNKLYVFFILIFLLGNIFAIDSSTKIFAVTPDGLGTTATLNLEIVDGKGHIWSRVGSLVGLTTQSTERTVIELAKKYSPNVNKYDFKFDITSEAEIVDGPSAGVAMAMLVITSLNQLEGKGNVIPNYVSATGTISELGEVGKVGGVLAKAEEAAKKRVKLFIVPQDDLEVVVKEDGEVKKVDLRKYAMDKLDLRVVGVKNIDEAIKYAFMPLDYIEYDDLKINNEILVYDPQRASLPLSLDKFKEYNLKYLEETKKVVEEAQKSINNIELDNDTRNKVYETWNIASKYYMDANKALENNHLYSGANYLFLANVYSNLVIDISKNPNVLKNNTEYLNEARILKEVIKKELEQLNKVPLDGFEWNISAKERLLWAEKNIEEILSSNVKSSSEFKDYTNNLEKFEFAKEWVKIAMGLKNNIPLQETYIDSSSYKDVSMDLLKKVYQSEEAIEKLQISDLDRRIYGAQKAYDRELYLTSIFESATVLAIVNSEIIIKDKKYLDLLSDTEILINKLKYELNNKEFIWANLFLSHAEYQLDSSKFYYTNEKYTQATQNLNSAHQLAMISENLLKSTKNIEDNKNILLVKNQIVEENINNDIYKMTIGILILIVLILLFIFFAVFLRNKIHGKHNENIYEIVDKNVYSLKDKLSKLDKKFLDGKINIEEYNKINEEYKKELKNAENNKREIALKNAEIEQLENEIKFVKSKLDNVTQLFKKGIIDNKEYDKKINEYKKSISSLKYEIEKDKKYIKKKE